MPERVVAYAPSPTRLVRIVGEQNALGNQVMAAFLNPHAARGYISRNPYPLVGDPLNGVEPAAVEGPPVAMAAAEETAVYAPDAAIGDVAVPAETPGFAAPAEAPASPASADAPPSFAPAHAPPAFAPPASAAPPLAPVGAVQAVMPRATGGPGQVFAVYSPRGGSGTSLLAATLASRIAQDPALRVLLVDLDLQNGSQSYYFDVTEQKRCSVLGLKPLIDEILVKCDGDLSRVVAEAPSVLSDEILMAKTFERENLRVLCALDDPAAIDDYVDPSSHMEALMAVLGNNFDVVILDLPNTVDQFTAPALFRSDRIVVVTPEDIPSQIKVARMLNLVLAPMIEAREMALQERCFLVVSRSSKKKLEVPMPIGIAASLPDDKKYLENFAESTSRSASRLAPAIPRRWPSWRRSSARGPPARARSNPGCAGPAPAHVPQGNRHVTAHRGWELRSSMGQCRGSPPGLRDRTHPRRRLHRRGLPGPTPGPGPPGGNQAAGAVAGRGPHLPGTLPRRSRGHGPARPPQLRQGLRVPR